MRPMPLLIGLILATSLLPLVAQAAGTTREATVGEQFNYLDRDHDGKLSPQEYPYPARFPQLDLNKDGFITLAEMQDVANGKVTQPQTGDTLENKFKLLDANRDGKISPTELGNPGMFLQMDANHDGFVTLDELRAYATRAAGGTATGPETNGNTVSVEQRFRMADKDGNGKLSEAEMGNAAYFQKADTNKDGFVSLEELRVLFGLGGNDAATGKTGDGKTEPSLEQRFKDADKDGDGKLSPTEVGNADFFKMADTNGDGFLSLAELRVGMVKYKNSETGKTNSSEPTAEQRFKEMDKNGDGKVTPDEFTNTEYFKRIDANADGIITLDELKAFLAKPKTGEPGASPEQRFRKLDTNGDGKLTPDEVTNAEVFKRIDTNNDGAISLDEFKAAQTPAKTGDGGKTTTETPKTEPTPEQRFKMFDKNGDGKLTPDELANADYFAKFDTNGDGVVTLAEFTAGVETMKPKTDKKPEPSVEDRFTQFDKNKDGKITPEEMPYPVLFKQLDTNGDGVITLDEAQAHAQAPAASAVDTSRMSAQELKLWQYFKQSDLNRDNRLNPEEFPNAEVFKKLDANGDGYVSWDEAKALLNTETTAKPKDATSTPEQWFKLKDKNGDGKLTADEIPYDNFFKLVDVNGNAAITLDELKTYITTLQNQ